MAEFILPELTAEDDAQRAHSRFRWGALAICAATLAVEGFDGQFMGYVVPGISQDWGVAPGTLWPALSAGLFGLMLGAFFVAPLADRVGRKRVVLGSVAAFGLLTILTAWADSLPALVVLRFLTGLGLGGAMPNAIALTAEFSPPEKRASAVAIMFCAFSLGAGIGGFAAVWLIRSYGWQSVFVFCGALAVVLVPVVAGYMPESYRPRSGRAPAIPVGGLFREGRTRITLLLWFIFFVNLMELFLLTSWLPTTISAQGISIGNAVVATALVQIGGAAAAFLLGPLVDRYGPRWIIAGAFVTASLCIAAIGLAGSSVALTMVTAFGAGIGTVGAQNCSNGVAAKFYPAPIRATGVGWALAVGRIGSIVGPAVGGILLATHVDIRTIFLTAAVPPLLAAGAYVLMGRVPEPDPREELGLSEELG